LLPWEDGKVSQRISDQHPLRLLFNELVRQIFRAQLGVDEPGVPEYMANILVDFTHRDRVFCLRSARGRQLEEVAEMLMEGDVALNAPSFEREREVHKHIGDFTLFWSGVYPEMLRYFRAADRRDHLIDYVAQGRKSYGIAASFDYGAYHDEARVLKQLADQFEVCMVGLNMVRRELDGLRDPQIQAVKRLLED
jgi:hypothetical protein